MSEKRGNVYLVGAGCGEADLITVRGLSLLRSCDAVVYDDLIAEELLEAVPEHAERIYMGKRSGRHSASQPEICEALIALARSGKTVVRLKGGDPFVFGRGGEEMLALRAAGIPCEEVPGISSAIAIPAAAGIPVTHRGVSQSFHVITAHTADTPDGLPLYMDQLARLPGGTLVFLMGLRQLPAIVDRLIAASMPADTPAAVISGGNAPHPATVRGTLRTIAGAAREAQVQAPAVIVVGAAAALELSSTLPKPLRGVRVGVTGTAAVTEKLKAALREQGAEAFSVERSLVEDLPFSFDLQTLCDGAPRWLVFTSGNGIRLFFRHLRRQNIDLRRLHACRFAVIGGATADTLREYGISADLCPDVFTSEALGRLLLQTVRPEEPVLLFRSRLGSRRLFQVLAERYAVRDIPLYDLRADTRDIEGTQAKLETADYLALSSASGVELFFRTRHAVPERAVCVCIGEVTAGALRRRYKKPFLTAPEATVRGIVAAVMRHHGKNPPGTMS